jgi:hypothetical protein
MGVRSPVGYIGAGFTMGWACAKNGESKYTQDGDGWSDVWKTPSREA